MYLSISHSFLDHFAWNMDQIQAISHVHTAAWPNNRLQPVITGYWPVIENFQNWKNRTDNFQKRQKPDRWSGHKSVQFGAVSVFFPVLRLDFETLDRVSASKFCYQILSRFQTYVRHPQIIPFTDTLKLSVTDTTAQKKTRRWMKNMTTLVSL